MTTDDKTLTEQIARAQVGSPTDYEWRTWGEDSPGLRAITLQNAARLLPIIRKAERDAAREAFDGLIADTAIDVRLGTEGNDPQRVQDAEAVMDAAQIYRDTEYPEETP